jgi:signal transduction histidine kinase
VEDDGPGFDRVDFPPGHGLALLRDRLAMAFGDRASLRIDSREGRTSVVMDLPRVGSDGTKPAKNGLS